MDSRRTAPDGRHIASERASERAVTDMSERRAIELSSAEFERASETAIEPDKSER